MSSVPKYLHLDNHRNGRSGLDPFDLLPGQVAEAYNVDGFDGMWGRKRRGADNVSLTGGTAPTVAFNALNRWVPGTDDTAAELWAIDGNVSAPIVKRLAGGVTWADVTLADNILSGTPQNSNFAALNGKLYIAYISGFARLHVYDPTSALVNFFILGDGASGASNDGGGGGGGKVLTGIDTLKIGNYSVVVGGAVASFNGHLAAKGAVGVATAAAGGASGSGKAGGAGDAAAAGGGGGGDSVAGSAGGSTVGGAGGAGTSVTVPGSGTLIYGSGGGGGASVTGGAAGTGAGAGGGGATPGASGTPARGGGGGGGGAGQIGGLGGIGMGALWYVTGTMTATGGTITTSGGFTIHTFTTGTTVFSITAITPSIRRVGIDPGLVAPTAADVGSGAYAATQRFYRVRFLQMNGVLTMRRSEPTPAVTFTPSGSGSGVTVTRPTAPGESETHWEVEVSTDGITFYSLAGVFGGTASTQVAITTTTYVDATVTTNYTLGALSDPSGYYTLPTAVKLIVSDGNRLVMAGDWQGVQTGSRVWFTPVLNSAQKGDDERIVITDFQKNYVDVGTKDGGEITALGYPINGVIFVFKYRAVWALYPTGDITNPYIVRKLRDDIGCVDQKTVATCKDISGNPALHFWDPLSGPWRISAQSGFEYLGRDMEDVIPTVNLAATGKVAHSLWVPALHQWWVYLSVGSNNDPTVKYVLDPLRMQRDEEGLLRGGWYKHDGDSAAARCSCLFANTLGSSMSSYLKPYVGLYNTVRILKCDSDVTTDDAGVAFQAYIDTSIAFPPLEPGVMMGIGEAVLTAKAASGVTIQMTTEADFGVGSKTSTVLLTAAGSETRVFKKFDDSNLSELTSLQVRLGDVSAVASAWVIDRLSIPLMLEGTK